MTTETGRSRGLGARPGIEIGPVAIFAAGLLVILLTFSLTSEQFLTTANGLSSLKHLSAISFAALGLTFVVIVGHADMSFHFVSCFAAMTMSFLIARGFSPLLASAVGLTSGAAFGALSGAAVGKLKLPDVIVTIAIGSTAWGLAYLYSNGSYIYENFLTSGIIAFADGRLFGVPYPVAYLSLAYALAYFLLHRTRFGRGFYATGGNRTAALFSGINVVGYVVVAFAVSSLLGSFGSILMTATQGNGNVKSGLTLLMPAWTAVFVGSSVFGRPTVVGTFLGAFLISILQDGFNLLGAPFYVRDLVVGATLAGACVISRMRLQGRYSSHAGAVSVS